MVTGQARGQQHSTGAGSPPTGSREREEAGPLTQSLTEGVVWVAILTL